MTMIAYKANARRVELDNWRSPENIGSETVEGEIQCSGSVARGGLDKSVFGGEYKAIHSKYRVTYPFLEHATLLRSHTWL